jgi:hypothetical protein
LPALLGVCADHVEQQFTLGIVTRSGVSIIRRTKVAATVLNCTAALSRPALERSFAA